MLRRIALALLALGWPLAASAQIIGTDTITAISTGGNCAVSHSCAVFAVSTNPSVTLQITGTFSQTLTFESTSDGSHWLPISPVDLAAGAVAATTTTTGSYAFLNTGIVGIRARCTAFTSGTATVTATRGTLHAGMGGGGGGGGGGVTSVNASFSTGLITVSGGPITTAGTLAFTVAGTSGGIPYFSGANTWASSGALTANLPVIGGGAGAAPSVGSRSGNTTTFVTTTGTQTSGKCVTIDANGNHVADANACGGGSTSGTNLLYGNGSGGFSNVTSSSVSGANVTLAGTLTGVGLIDTSTETKTTSATLSKDVTYCNPAGGAVDLTLPNVSTFSGYTFYVKQITSAANACTVKGTIDGATDDILGGIGYGTSYYSNGVTYTAKTQVTPPISAGTSGQVLTSNGAGAAPSFQTVSGTGTVTSIATTGPIGGGTITTTGTITCTTCMTGTTPTNHGVLLGGGAQTVGVTAAGTAGYVLTGAGASDPTFVQQFNRTMLIVGNCQGGSTASLSANTQASGAATAGCTGTTITEGTASFADATTNELQYHFTIPDNWDGAAMTLSGFWRTTATSNSVTWQVKGVCGTDGAVLPTAYSSTADTVADTAKGTTLQRNAFSITLSVASNHSLATCSAGNEFYMVFFRDNSDSLGQAAVLMDTLTIKGGKNGG